MILLLVHIEYIMYPKQNPAQLDKPIKLINAILGHVLGKH